MIPRGMRSVAACLLSGLVFAGPSASAGVFGEAVRVKGVAKSAMAVAREGSRLYVAAGNELAAFDISNPLCPRRLGSVTGVDNRRQLAVKDSIAYLVSRETGLRLVDFADPTAPRIRSRFDTVEFATGIDVAGDVAFVSERINGVEFVDVTDPDNPAHIAIRKTGESQSNRYRDGYLYSGEWGLAQVTVFDAHDLRDIREIGRLDLHGFGDGLEIAGDHLYCSTGHDARHRPDLKGAEAAGRGRGLDIFSLADPAKPVYVGRVDFPRFVPRDDDYWTVRVAQGVAYCADSHNGLFAVDVKDPAAPKVIDRFCLPQENRPAWPSGAVSSLAVGEGCLYVTVNPGGLFVLPVKGMTAEVREKGRLPLHPEYREAYPTDTNEFFVYKPVKPGQARTVAVHGGFVYAAFGDAGLHVLKLGDAGFEKVGELSGRKVYDCCFCGGRLVTAEGLDGFAVYALEGPAGFREVARRAQLSAGQSMAFWCWAPDDETVVLTGRNGGREFYPLADINRKEPLLSIWGTCQWDKYLADRAVDGVLADLVPYQGLQWVAKTAQGWQVVAKPVVKDGERPRAAGQTCGVCTFGDGFLSTFSTFGAADGKPRARPAVVFLGKDRRAGSEIGLAGGGDGIPRSDGRYVALNNRSQKVVTLYDFADAKAPKLLKTWRLSGNPDLTAFIGGRLVVPAGHQGLLATRKALKAIGI